MDHVSAGRGWLLNGEIGGLGLKRVSVDREDVGSSRKRRRGQGELVISIDELEHAWFSEDDSGGRAALRVRNLDNGQACECIGYRLSAIDHRGQVKAEGDGFPGGKKPWIRRPHRGIEREFAEALLIGNPQPYHHKLRE